MLQAAVNRQKHAQIVTAVRRGEITIISRDVYNVKRVERARIPAGRYPHFDLLDNLEEHPIAPMFAKFGAQRKLTHPLITFPYADKICRRYNAGKV